MIDMLCAMEFKNRLVCLFLEGTITTKMFQFQRSKEFQWSLQLQFVIGIYPWIWRIIRDQEINGNRLNASKLPTYQCVYLLLFDHSVAIQKFLTLNIVFKTWHLSEIYTYHIMNKIFNHIGKTISRKITLFEIHESSTPKEFQ